MTRVERVAQWQASRRPKMRATREDEDEVVKSELQARALARGKSRNYDCATDDPLASIPCDGGREK